MCNCPAPQSRKLLLGDANAILRVWTFLDAWGLINHEAPAGPAAPAQPPFDIVTAGARAVSALGSCVVHRALLSQHWSHMACEYRAYGAGGGLGILRRPSCRVARLTRFLVPKAVLMACP